jgi:pyoverdine/dityrosine biosynthesis protein Dit1
MIETNINQPAVGWTVPRYGGQLYTDIEEVLRAVACPVLRRGNHDSVVLAEFLESPLGLKLREKIARGEKLTFLLPAFPAKSSNRAKTESAAPDLGEFLALSSLDEMCAEIGLVYSPGAEVIICSDGRVFNDLVRVSDADLELYSQRIAQIIATENLTHLRTYSLEDCTELDRTRIREDLVDRYGPSLESIRKGAEEDPGTRMMINGIHRFMKDDLAVHFPQLSKNRMMLLAKDVAYQVVQRSRSWDGLLATKFPDALRLSIHPYALQHRKFGVKLVSSSDRWATPWHNVTVQDGAGYRLMPRSEAVSRGGTLKFLRGTYAYYEL